MKILYNLEDEDFLEYLKSYPREDIQRYVRDLDVYSDDVFELEWLITVAKATWPNTKKTIILSDVWYDNVSMSLHSVSDETDEEYYSRVWKKYSKSKKAKLKRQTQSDLVAEYGPFIKS